MNFPWWNLSKVFLVLLVMNRCVQVTLASDWVDETANLLQEGNEKIQYHKNKNSILVLGSSGNGKSTLTQWLVNPESIRAEETFPGSGEFTLFDDRDTIGHDITNSMTVFPTLSDYEREFSMYDCPGFDDTRNASYQVAIAHFLKNVADYSEKVKMIFVINEDSVKIGGSRDGLTNLLKHATTFVKDIGKFENSIMLIVTKVQNRYIHNGREMEFVEDDVTIERFVKFLEKVIGEMNEKLQNSKTEAEKLMYQNQITLLRIFVRKDDKYEEDQYRNIGIFRAPDKEGLLSENPLYEVQWGRIGDIILHDLEYTPKSEDDFGYTVNSDALVGIQDLTDQIELTIESSFGSMDEQLKSEYQHTIGTMLNDMMNFLNDPSKYPLNISDAKYFSQQFKRRMNFTQTLSDEIKSGSINNVKNLSDTFIALQSEFEIDAEIQKFFTTRGDFINTIEKITKKELKFPVLSWQKMFAQMNQELKTAYESITKEVTEIYNGLLSSTSLSMKKIANGVRKHQLQVMDPMNRVMEGFMNGQSNLAMFSPRKFASFKEQTRLFEIYPNKLEALTTVYSDLKPYVDATEMYADSFGLTENFKHLKNLDKGFNYVKAFSGLSKNLASYKPIFTDLRTFVNFNAENFGRRAENSKDFIMTSITNDFQNIARSIQTQFYRENGVIDSDFKDMSEKLSSKGSVIRKSILNLKKAINMDEIINESYDLADKLMLNQTEVKPILGSFALKRNFFEFLEKLDQQIQVFVNFESLEKTTSIFDDGHRWFYYLKQVSEKVAEDDSFRNKISPYTNKCELKISKQEFLEFNKLVNRVSNLYNVLMIRPLPLNTKTLNKVLESLSSNFEVICNEKTGTITITGNILKTSDFNAKDRESILKLCGNVNSLNDFKNIELFATQKIIINDNFSSIGFDLSIIAPELEVVGTKKFLVKGMDGEPFDYANDNRLPGSHGTFGRPGELGKSFFALTKNILQSENLNLELIGGSGSDGQNGADGLNGKNGSNAVVPDGNCKFDTSVSHNITNIGNDIRRIYINGSESRGGTNGGDSGEGGYGHNAGLFEILSLEKDHKVKTKTAKGSRGADGRAGSKGLKGYMYSSVSYCTSNSLKYSLSYVTESSETIDGRTGVLKGAEETSGDPTPVDKAAVIIRYKKFLVEQILHNNIYKKTIKEFYDYLGDNRKVKELFQAAELTEEFDSLEQTLIDSGKDALPFFYDFFNRLEKIATSENFVTKQDQRKVLKYLWAAVHGKITYMKSLSEADFIIDMKLYLESVQDYITDIKEKLKISDQKTSEKIKIDMINDHRDQYSKQIMGKINEAIFFVKNDVTPAVNDIKPKIDEKIKQLVEDVIKIKRKATDEKAELEKLKTKMEKMLIVHAIFGVFDTTVKFMGAFGPHAKLASEIIGIGSSVAQSFLPNYSPNDVNKVKIPPSVGQSLQAIKTDLGYIANSKSQKIVQLIDSVVESISDTKGLQVFLIKLNKTKEDVIKNKDNSEFLLDIEEKLSIEIKNALEQTSYKRRKRADDPVKDVLEYTKTGVQAVSNGIDIFKKFQKDQEQIETVNQFIKDAGDKIVKINNYQKNIEAQMVPMVTGMMNQMNDVINNINGKSPVVLDVTKWKVQGMLKDIKQQLTKFTEGFDVQEDLGQMVEKLDDAMTTMIVIYDRIQSYQDQQNLGSYIAQIAADSVTNVLLTDPKLDMAAVQLEIKIRSNIILQKHKNVMKSFRQWVFPFANIFLNFNESNIPLVLTNSSEKTISNFADTAIEDLGKIKSRFIEYQAMIAKQDKYIVISDFDARFVSSKPFYVWNNQKFNQEISKLLSGEKVVLYADVKESDLMKESVKFSKIDFQFKMADNSSFVKLNEQLQSFIISATHVGHSYYNFEKKTYVITSEKQTIEYSFEHKSNGEPVRKNEVYNKIARGDLLLSPYSMWEITLKGSQPDIDFGTLREFRNKVDLHLAGFGTFIERSSDFPDLQVDEYYKDEISYLLE